ncbi:MAG: HD domain-containing protein [Deltaproteobacteria bacterium]|nr:HD domain-containing protein [Deltaproteobacteria bacterium]
MISIHDPIHGTIEVSEREIKLVDSRAFQRLRHIKQLGFSELAFPGATHSRYAHSLGAMHVATRMHERLFADVELAAADRERLRQTLRLAMLFHDLGHPPMSHVSERVMPKVAELGLSAWVDKPERQATHEDYTVKLLVDSELTPVIEAQLGDVGVSGSRIAALVAGRAPPGDPKAFVIGDVDYLPLLSQVVSSELDADRMDYLLRDSYYCGVSYGQFDHAWLIGNLRAVTFEGRLLMALQHKGVWAFENFLLARFHMFLAVYYHHTSECFDHLLGRYYDSSDYRLPPDSERYLQTDDVQLLHALRQSQSPWAERVIRRRAYRLLLETHSFGEGAEDRALDEKLQAAGVDFFRVRSRGILSKYFKKRDKTFPLLVLEPELNRVRRIEEYTPLYRRFEDAVALSRVFCKPEQLPQARSLLGPHPA